MPNAWLPWNDPPNHAGRPIDVLLSGVSALIERAGDAFRQRSAVTAIMSMVLPLPGRPVPRTLILDAAGGRFGS